MLCWGNETNRSHFTECSCIGRKGHNPGPNTVSDLKLMLVSFNLFYEFKMGSNI